MDYFCLSTFFLKQYALKYVVKLHVFDCWCLPLGLCINWGGMKSEILIIPEVTNVITVHIDSIIPI